AQLGGRGDRGSRTDDAIRPLLAGPGRRGRPPHGVRRGPSGLLTANEMRENDDPPRRECDCLRKSRVRASTTALSGTSRGAREWIAIHIGSRAYTRGARWPPVGSTAASG